jgi:hypothetical protein
MEKDKDDILQKDRSGRACISAGYRLYMSNFKRIFRFSWVAALVFAIVTSISGTMLILRPRLALFSLLTIIIVEALFASYGFAVLKQHQQTGAISYSPKWFNLDVHIFVRTLKAWINLFVIYIVVVGVVSGITVLSTSYLPLYTAIGLTGLFGLLALIFLLPLAYTNTRYVLTDGIGYWQNLSERYGIGLRRWGFIFLVVFVTTLFLSVVSLLTSLPALILSIANQTATMGYITGDPLGMPSYIGWLAAVVFLLIGFIQAYVMLSFLFPIYYMYGAIDAHEKERKEFNKTKA